MPAEGSLQYALQLLGGTRICGLKRGGLIAGNFRLTTLKARFDEIALVGIARLVPVFIAEVHFITGDMLPELT